MLPYILSMIISVKVINVISVFTLFVSVNPRYSIHFLPVRKRFISVVAIALRAHIKASRDYQSTTD